MADRIPLRYAQKLLQLAPMSRADLRTELDELKLPLVLLEKHSTAQATISAEEYGRLFMHLVKQLQPQLDASGTADTEMVFSAYRMMFEAMLRAPDLEQAMQRAAVYFRRLGYKGETFSLAHNGEEVSCCFEFAHDTDRGLESVENFSVEELSWLPGATGRLLSMALWHRMCSWFIGDFIVVNSAEMQDSGKTGRSYSDLFGVPIAFNASRDAFSFQARYLAFPIVQSDASLNTLLETYPAELLKLSAAETRVAARVKQLIGVDFERELPGLAEVADRLHMTTPTLHRRLQEEGTSFRQLKEETRREAAISYLMQGHYTTSQLAELMGFSDSSTFHRAFKKWTGLTPQAYRQQNLEGN